MASVVSLDPTVEISCTVHSVLQGKGVVIWQLPVGRSMDGFSALGQSYQLRDQKKQILLYKGQTQPVSA